MKTLKIILIIVLLIVFVPIAWTMSPILCIIIVIALILWGLFALFADMFKDFRDYFSMRKRTNNASGFESANYNDIYKRNQEENKKESIQKINEANAPKTTSSSNFQIEGLDSITDPYIGTFIGASAVAHPGDKNYTISITYQDKLIGYLPSGQQGIHAIILALGGSVPCSGKIISRTDENGKTTLLGFVDLQI